MTVTIQIGNSDDKLSQSRWSAFVEETAYQINRSPAVIHFHAASPGSERWQNAAWVIEISPKGSVRLAVALTELRKAFDQDSIAWTEGETQFL